jgi:hypothetical protein
MKKNKKKASNMKGEKKIKRWNWKKSKTILNNNKINQKNENHIWLINKLKEDVVENKIKFDKWIKIKQKTNANKKNNLKG